MSAENVPPKVSTFRNFRRPESASARSQSKWQTTTNTWTTSSNRSRPISARPQQRLFSGEGDVHGVKQPILGGIFPVQSREVKVGEVGMKDEDEHPNSRDEVLKRALNTAKQTEFQGQEMSTRPSTASGARGMSHIRSRQSPNTSHRQLRNKKRRPVTAQAVARESVDYAKFENESLSRALDKTFRPTVRNRGGMLTEETVVRGINEPLQQSLQAKMDRSHVSRKIVSSGSDQSDEPQKITVREYFSRRANAAYVANDAALHQRLMEEDFKQLVEQEQRDEWLVEELHLASPTYYSPFPKEPSQMVPPVGARAGDQATHPTAVKEVGEMSENEQKSIPAVDSYEAKLTSKLIDLLRGSVDGYIEKQRAEIDDFSKSKGLQTAAVPDNDVSVKASENADIEKDIKIAVLETSLRLLRARLREAEKRKKEAQKISQDAQAEKDDMKKAYYAMERKKFQLNNELTKSRKRTETLNRELQSARERAFSLLGENDSLHEEVESLKQKLNHEREMRSLYEQEMYQALESKKNERHRTGPKLEYLMNMLRKCKQVKVSIQSLNSSLRMTSFNIDYDVKKISSSLSHQLSSYTQREQQVKQNKIHSRMNLEDSDSRILQLSSKLAKEKQDREEEYRHFQKMMRYAQYKLDSLYDPRTVSEEEEPVDASVPARCSKRPPKRFGDNPSLQTPRILVGSVSRSCQTASPKPLKTVSNECVNFVTTENCVRDLHRCTGSAVSIPPLEPPGEKRISPCHVTDQRSLENEKRVQEVGVQTSSPESDTVVNQSTPKLEMEKTQAKVSIRPSVPMVPIEQTKQHSPPQITRLPSFVSARENGFHVTVQPARAKEFAEAQMQTCDDGYDSILQRNEQLEKQLEDQEEANKALDRNSAQTVANNLSLQRALRDESEYNSKLRTKVHYMHQENSRLKADVNTERHALEAEKKKREQLLQSMEDFKKKITDISTTKLFYILRQIRATETKLKSSCDTIKSFVSSRVATDTGIQPHLKKGAEDAQCEKRDDTLLSDDGFRETATHQSPNSRSLQTGNTMHKTMEDAASGKLSMRQMRSFVETVVTSQQRKQRMSSRLLADQTSRLLETLWENILGCISKCRQVESDSTTETQRLHLGLPAAEEYLASSIKQHFVQHT